jgi:hypothetical protein
MRYDTSTFADLKPIRPMATKYTTRGDLRSRVRVEAELPFTNVVVFDEVVKHVQNVGGIFWCLTPIKLTTTIALK